MGVVKQRRIARNNLELLTSNPSKVLFIHYAKSNTYDEDYGNISPIITSIVIKSLDHSIDQQFAIHFEADKADIPKDQIQDSYRDLEMRILKLFNDFVRRHNGCIWVHWDMMNIHFGFEAIKHRHEKIFGDANDYVEIPSNNKKNLRIILEGMYGENFVNNGDKLKNLVSCNTQRTVSNVYLSEDSESQEFQNKNFNEVIKSVEMKVDFIKSATSKLTKSKLIVENRNGYAIFIGVIVHPIFQLIGWIVGILGFIFGFYQ